MAQADAVAAELLIRRVTRLMSLAPRLSENCAAKVADNPLPEAGDTDSAETTATPVLHVPMVCQPVDAVGLAILP